jgi:hypothetical protein
VTSKKLVFIKLTFDEDDADEAQEDGIDRLANPEIELRFKVLGEARTAPE